VTGCSDRLWSKESKYLAQYTVKRDTFIVACIAKHIIEGRAVVSTNARACDPVAPKLFDVLIKIQYSGADVSKYQNIYITGLAQSHDFSII
jgi:hypothetical protein